MASNSESGELTWVGSWLVQDAKYKDIYDSISAIVQPEKDLVLSDLV